MRYWGNGSWVAVLKWVIRMGLIKEVIYNPRLQVSSPNEYPGEQNSRGRE